MGASSVNCTGIVVFYLNGSTGRRQLQPEKQRDLSFQEIHDPEDPEFSLLVPEKSKAITAIKQLNLRTTPPELATKSGLSINQASFWLNKIAGETGGKLEVAADGTVFYTFSRDFTNAYLQRGLRKAALIAGAFLFQFLYWLIRMSFGFALVLSVLVIIVIFVALIVIAIAALFGDNGSGDGGGLDFDFAGGFFDLRFLGDLFSWSYSPSHSSYPNSVPSTRRDQYSDFVETHPKGNFFLECFSFLFGDGRPNSNLQEIRWQQIAKTIKANGGVVSSEQLAPFLDGDGSDSGMILSALAQFNGRPEVSKSGYILYVFPDFLEESTAPEIHSVRSEPYLAEDDWQFSSFPPDILSKVLLLACLNFAGSWWLFKHIATINLLHHLAILIDVLLTYAVIFLLIPSVRFIVILMLNNRIKQRNERRQAAFELVNRPQGKILQEIQEGREIRQKELAELKQDRTIIYSSDKDSLEQQFEQNS